MDARSLPWDDLQIFLVTAKGGTLAAGASELGIDASTVHRRIARLEAVLRTRLFERSPRGYALTSAGEDLLGHVRVIEEEVLTVRRKLEGLDQRLEGTVRLATVDDLVLTHLSSLMRKFRDRHPGVTLDVSVRSELADLGRHEADVAIRFGGKPAIGDLVAKHVTRVDLAFYGSRAYLKKHGRPASLADLGAHAIVRGDERIAGIPSERMLEPYVGVANVAFRSNSFLARRAAVRDGLGVGLLAVFMARRERDLVRLEIDTSRLSADLWIVVHADLRKNARVRAFVDFVYAGLARQRESFTMS